MTLNIPMALDFANNFRLKQSDAFLKYIEKNINNAYRNGNRWAYFEHFPICKMSELEKLVIPYGYKVVKLEAWDKLFTQLIVEPATEA